MALVIDDILSAAEAEVLHEAAQELEFESGARTAGRLARGVKDNLQAGDTPGRAAVLRKAQSALERHPVFQAWAIPRQITHMLVSRTQGGGQYGDHVDNALMGGGRADVSFTLFLTPQDDYAGGELTITDAAEARSFRLDQGAAIVYPSDTVHRVEPVQSGTRTVIVGWVTSWVADPRGRDILFDLWQAMMAAEADGSLDQARLISKSRSNLLRMWAR